MLRDFTAFTALFIFLYGMGLVALAMDEPPRSTDQKGQFHADHISIAQ